MTTVITLIALCFGFTCIFALCKAAATADRKAEAERQRRSFAHISNPNVTRKMIDDAADRMND